MIRVTLSVRVRQPWVDQPLLLRVARGAARELGFTSGDLSIAIIGDTAMKALHARTMNDPTTTDVLTFDLGSDRALGRIDGEIVACAAVAHRHAAALTSRRRHAAAAELALYVTHGVLHLAGYDDRTPAAFRKMHAREDQILQALGLGPLFSRGQ